MVNDPDFNAPAFLRPLRKMQRLKKMEKQQREREQHEQKAAHLRQQMQEAEQQGNPELAQKLLQQALRHEQEVDLLAKEIKKFFVFY